MAFVATLAVFAFSAFNIMDNPKGAGQFKPEDFDKAVKPGDDFFEYVNGGWLKKNEIPGTESRWGAFNEVDELRYKVLHQLLNEAAADKDAKEGTNRRKVGDYYASGMDSAALNKAGMTPLDAELKKIDAIGSAKDLVAANAWFISQGGGFMYGLGPDQDLMLSDRMALYAGQGGLGLPDRDFYFRTDTATQRIQSEYKKYVANNLQAVGYDAAKAKDAAEAIYKLEASLADKSMSRVQLRDPYASYNKMSVADFSKQTSNIAWANHLDQIGVPKVDSIIVGQPEFFKRLDSLMTAVPIQTWKDYLKAHLVDGANAFLDDASVMRAFNFRSKTLTGTKAPKPRWKRVLNVIDGTMGEALGEEYVKKAFTPESKQRMQTMIENMRTAMKGRIQKLDWMSDETKKAATAKLEKVMVKIGYPDKWRDYNALAISRNSYYENANAAGKFEFKRQLAKLGKPIDRTEWGMNAYTVNAYYNPLNNEIVFPAGILQPPFFDPQADDAVIYGGIGAVICHELTHGFDDQGSQFDATGNLRKWWTEDDEKKFKAKTEQVANQFDKYQAFPDLPVNGKLTLGENIADLGGVNIALDALKQTDQYKKGEKIDGFTPTQRFFLNWARVWRTKYTDAALRNQVLTNPHSPGNFRCNGPITNADDWYTAFNVQPGDKWYVKPEDRAKIW